MEDTKIEVRCPFIDVIRDYFPIVPLVIPLLPMLLVATCLWMYLSRITRSLERQEALLKEMIVETQRRS